MLTLTTQCLIFYSKHTHIGFSCLVAVRIFRQKLYIGELTLRGLKEKNKRLCVLSVKVEKMEEGCLYIVCVCVIASKALIGCLHWAACHHAWRNQLSLSWNLWRSEDDGGDGWKGRPGRGVLTIAVREAKNLDKKIFVFMYGQLLFY